MTSRIEADFSLLATPQQLLGERVSPKGDVSPELVFALARACVPHCLAAAEEVSRGFSEASDAIDLLMFINEHGASAALEGESEYYEAGRGWLMAPLADRLRAQGKTVVCQNLYHGASADIEPAFQNGRIRRPEEGSLLTDRMTYGGPRSDSWVGAIDETLRAKGLVVATLNIPRMDGKGLGGHSVLVTEVVDDNIIYFDPDLYAKARYERGNYGDSQIMRIDSDDGQLFYSQPSAKFCERMTGEVMHIITS